jgi:CheY-like chemotaxis protein
VTETPSALAIPRTVSPAKAGSSGESLKGKTVLVLDDEESLRTLLEEGLSAHGLRVESAATIEEAIARLRHSAYDVLLCDLHLSSGGVAVNGRAASSRMLEAAGANKPALIFMTGDLIENADGAVGRGEPVFLQKPFRISEVLTILQEVLAAPAGNVKS